VTSKEWVKKWMFDHKHLKMGNATALLMLYDYEYDKAKGDIVD